MRQLPRCWPRASCALPPQNDVRFGCVHDSTCRACSATAPCGRFPVTPNGSKRTKRTGQRHCQNLCVQSSRSETEMQAEFGTHAFGTRGTGWGSRWRRVADADSGFNRNGVLRSSDFELAVTGQCYACPQCPCTGQLCEHLVNLAGKTALRDVDFIEESLCCPTRQWAVGFSKLEVKLKKKGTLAFCLDAQCQSCLEYPSRANIPELRQTMQAEGCYELVSNFTCCENPK